jgi:prepilin-type N-terminal cleavage/methylation domain-containing protein
MRLIARLRALHRREDGFTLPELIITVTIIGVISAGLAGVVLSFLKTTTDTQARLTESHDVQFATAYWQRDVASIGVRGWDATSKSFPLQQSVNITPACSLPAGTRVATLAWSEYTSTSLDSTATPTTITVSYVAEPDTGGYNLIRTRCTGATKDSEFEVMHSLNALPTVTCDISCTSASVPMVVSLDVSVLDPDGHGSTALTATLSGERRQT